MNNKSNVIIAVFAAATSLGGMMLLQNAERNNATARLEKDGYSNVDVKVGQFAQSSAPLFNVYGAPFSATDAAGKEVKGTITRQFGGTLSYSLKK